VAKIASREDQPAADNARDGTQVEWAGKRSDASSGGRVEVPLGGCAGTTMSRRRATPITSTLVTGADQGHTRASGDHQHCEAMSRFLQH